MTRWLKSPLCAARMRDLRVLLLPSKPYIGHVLLRRTQVSVEVFPLPEGGDLVTAAVTAAVVPGAAAGQQARTATAAAVQGLQL
jgi:hypothetical protein